VLPVVIDGDMTYYNIVAGEIKATIFPVNHPDCGILWVDKETKKDSGLSMILGEAIERAES